MKKDIDILTDVLPKIKTRWDGVDSILELKEADYNWRQMEWLGFYFEYLCRKLFGGEFEIPGGRYDGVNFDVKRQINWDLKAHAIKSDVHRIILNDCLAMEASAREHGAHGEIVALCDVVYNDADRSFQKWHTELKGGKSAYEIERESRTSVSRYRKTSANLVEILILTLTGKDLEKLPVMRQGRNSNGAPRSEKYMLDLENLDGIKVEKIVF